jgi:RNA polymerase sigma-70 factor (ECF subfamily)
MQVPGRSAAYDYEKAVNDHFNDLYRFAYWLCRNRWQAEDLIQEALLRGWRGWTGLREERAVKAWLFTIVRREFQRTAPRVARGEPVPDADDRAFSPDPTQSMDVERALGELPEVSREALLMQVLGGFSCSEISDALGASKGAVMTRLTRARQALRRRLGTADVYEVKQG